MLEINSSTKTAFFSKVHWHKSTTRFFFSSPPKRHRRVEI
jgi:hypothetical protein